jgi:hypothetical protein
MASVRMCDGRHDGRPIGSGASPWDDRHLVQPCRHSSDQIELRGPSPASSRPYSSRIPVRSDVKSRRVDSCRALASHSGTPSSARSSVSVRSSRHRGKHHQIERRTAREAERGEPRAVRRPARGPPGRLAREPGQRRECAGPGVHPDQPAFLALVLHGHDCAAGGSTSGDERRADRVSRLTVPDAMSNGTDRRTSGHCPPASIATERSTGRRAPTRRHARHRRGRCAGAGTTRDRQHTVPRLAAFVGREKRHADPSGDTRGYHV